MLNTIALYWLNKGNTEFYYISSSFYYIFYQFSLNLYSSKYFKGTNDLNFLSNNLKFWFLWYFLIPSTSLTPVLLLYFYFCEISDGHLMSYLVS